MYLDISNGFDSQKFRNSPLVFQSLGQWESSTFKLSTNDDRMPIQREHFQFFLIFLCVPIQYWIVNQSGSTESTRSYQLSLIIQDLKDFHTKYFKIESWIKWLREMQVEQRPDPGTGESIAKEVLEYREKVDQGHFASSTKIRDIRKPQVNFSSK